MVYSHEVETMCPIAQGVAHGAAPIPEEAKWVKAKEIKDISGFTHGTKAFLAIMADSSSEGKLSPPSFTAVTLNE